MERGCGSAQRGSCRPRKQAQQHAAAADGRHQGTFRAVTTGARRRGRSGGEEEEEEKEDKLRSFGCIIHSFAPLFCWNKLQRGRILSSPRPFRKKSLSNPGRGPVPAEARVHFRGRCIHYNTDHLHAHMHTVSLWTH